MVARTLCRCGRARRGATAWLCAGRSPWVTSFQLSGPLWAGQTEENYAHRLAVRQLVRFCGRRRRASSICARAPAWTIAGPSLARVHAVCHPVSAPRSPFPPTLTTRMTRVKGAGDTRRRRAQRLRNGHLAASPSPPCTCTGPYDHGIAHGPPPPPPPPPEPCVPTRHCSRPRSCGCIGPCDHGAMDGGHPRPPRAMQPRSAPRLPHCLLTASLTTKVSFTHPPCSGSKLQPAEVNGVYPGVD